MIQALHVCEVLYSVAFKYSVLECYRRFFLQRKPLRWTGTLTLVLWLETKTSPQNRVKMACTVSSYVCFLLIGILLVGEGKRTGLLKRQKQCILRGLQITRYIFGKSFNHKRIDFHHIFVWEFQTKIRLS